MEFMVDKKGEGYLREQVDAYIRELRQTYQQMYEAHQVMRQRYDELERRHDEQLKRQQRLEADAEAYQSQKDAIAQALIQAQMAAQSVLANAQAEADRMHYPGYQQQPYGMAQGGTMGGIQNGMQGGMYGNMPGGYY